MPGHSSRPFGPLKGDLLEVRAFAEWMRERIAESGMTLAEVAAGLDFGRDKLSKLVNGERRPDFLVVKQILGRVTVDRASLPRVLSEAKTRWDMADAALAHPLELPVATRPGQPSPGEADATHALERERGLTEQLAEAFKRCADLERALGDSKVMIAMLKGMVATLEKEKADLTSQREQLIASRPPVDAQVGVVEQRLGISAGRRQRADGALQRALRERDEARRLIGFAEDRVTDLLAEIAVLRGAQRGAVQPTDVASVAVPALAGFDADIDQVLDAADQALERQAEQLADIAGDLEVDTAADRFVFGRVVGQLPAPEAVTGPWPDAAQDDRGHPRHGRVEDVGQTLAALVGERWTVGLPRQISVPFSFQLSMLPYWPSETAALSRHMMSVWDEYPEDERRILTDEMIRRFVAVATAHDVRYLLKDLARGQGIRALPRRRRQRAATEVLPTVSADRPPEDPKDYTPLRSSVMRAYARTADPASIVALCGFRHDLGSARKELLEVLATDRADMFDQLADLDTDSWSELMSVSSPAQA